MLRTRSAFRCAVQKDEDGRASVSGRLVSYGGPMNRNGWLFAPGAAKASLETTPSEEAPLPMLYEHEYAIGRWLAAADSQPGIEGSGQTATTERAKEVVTLLDDRAINGISIGFDPDWDQTYLLAPGEELDLSTPYGEWHYQAVEWEVVFARMELMEASIVSVPADPSARVAQAVLAKRAVALPGLRAAAEWEDVAYSMALLMGGRGAGQAFEDVDELERLTMYQKLARGYQRLGRTPPPYDPAPAFKQVAFRHDERQVFADRYLRKSLASVSAGAAGIEGPLSPALREQAEQVCDRLGELLERKGVTDELEALSQRLAGLATDLKGANGNG